MYKALVLERIHKDGLAKLREFCDVEEFLNGDRAEILSAIADVDVVICKSATHVDREFVDHARSLKAVGRAGTGLENFDQEYLRQKNIPLLRVPAGNSRSTAEFAIMAILMLLKNAIPAIDAVRHGDFRRSLLEGRELARTKVGLIGFGNVGRLVAERLLPFECEILVYDARPGALETASSMGCIAAAGVNEVFAASDVVSLHTTLTKETRGLVGKSLLDQAKPGLWLVNAARGGLMVDEDVLSALETGHLAGLAIDTLYPEPPFDAAPGDHAFSHPLLNHPKVQVFPHMAASTRDAQQTIAVELVEKLREVLEKAA